MIFNVGGDNIATNYEKGIASYLAFVGNVNADMVDSAFGKNNEDIVSGIGKALAMYAKYKDPTIDIDVEFPNLITSPNLNELTLDAKAEILENSTLTNFVIGNAYAKEKFCTQIGNSISVSKAYSGDVGTAQIDIEVTEEMLLKNDLFVYYSLSVGLSKYSDGSYANISLNDVMIENLKQVVSSTASSTKYLRLILSDYGITSPGTYPLVIKAYGPRKDVYSKANATLYSMN